MSCRRTLSQIALVNVRGNDVRIFEITGAEKMSVATIAGHWQEDDLQVIVGPKDVGRDRGSKVGAELVLVGTRKSE